MPALELGSPSTESDIEFWTRQLHEHAKFLFNLIEDSDLARRAKSLDVEFQNARRDNEGKTAPDQLRRLAFPVLKLRELEAEVLNKQSQGEWLGWVLPSFVEGMLAQLDYFWAKATGLVVLPADDVAAWCGFLAANAAVIARLVDPSESAAFDDGLLVSRRFADLQYAASRQPVAVSFSEAQKLCRELDRYLSSASSVKSSLSPLMISHNLRLCRRFLTVAQ